MSDTKTKNSQPGAASGVAPPQSKHAPLPVYRRLPNRIVLGMQLVLLPFLLTCGLYRFVYCGLVPALMGVPFFLDERSPRWHSFVRNPTRRIQAYSVAAFAATLPLWNTPYAVSPIIAAIIALEMLAFEAVMAACATK